jgi:hypothetical protein
MSKRKITPKMVQDWVIEMDDCYHVLADLANNKMTPSQLRENIEIYIDDERSSR